MNYRQMARFLPFYCLISLVGNWAGAGGVGLLSSQGLGASAALFCSAIPGLLALLAMIVLGLAITHYIPWKGIPAVGYIVTLACIVTIPGFPGAEALGAWTAKVNFVGLCSPILAYAGIAVGKDMELLKKQGWRIVLVGFFVFIGTYIGSAVIAEVVLRIMN